MDNGSVTLPTMGDRSLFMAFFFLFCKYHSGLEFEEKGCTLGEFLESHKTFVPEANHNRPGGWSS